VKQDYLMCRFQSCDTELQQIDDPTPRLRSTVCVWFPAPSAVKTPEVLVLTAEDGVTVP